MKLKKVLPILILLILIVTGCRSEIREAGELDPNLVWDTYSNDYYGVKYPSEWNKVVLGDNVGFSSPDNDSLWLDIRVLEVGSRSKFEEVIESEIDMLKTLAKVDSVNRTRRDGNLTYIISAERKDGKKQGKFVFAYKNGLRFDLHFRTENNNYDNDLKILNQIINSFELFDFEPIEVKRIIEKEEVTTEEALEDARYLWDRLEEIHPNLYHTKSREEARDGFVRIEEELKSKPLWDRFELYKLLLPFVGGFRDGHTNLSINDFDEYIEDNGIIIPIRIDFRGEDIIIVEDYSQNNIPVGSTIISINGISIDDIIKDMKKIISYENDIYAQHLIRNRFQEYLFVNYGFGDKFEIEYKYKEDNVKSAVFEGVEYSEFLQIDNERNDKEDYSRWKLYYPDRKVALLEINEFDGNFTEYQMFIDNSFKEMKEKKVEVLIIDLRNNGGGDTNFGDYLYEFITNKPYRSFSRVETKLSDYSIEFEWDYYYYFFGYGQMYGVSQLNSSGEDRIVIEEKEFIEERNNPFKFAGQVYLLIGNSTFSAGTNFATMVKDFDMGIIIGEETGGLASTYGDFRNGTLPNTRIHWTVSSKYFLRLAGYDDGRGVIPDIEVNVDLLKTSQVLDKILKIIKEGN